MTNSPEPPQRDERRRGAASPLEFDEWVALLVAFGVLGSIFWWSLRPQTGGGSWLGGSGGGEVGLIGNAKGDLDGSISIGAADADGSGLLAQAPGKEETLIVEKDDHYGSSKDRSTFLSRRNAAAGATAAATAGLAAVGGNAAEAPAEEVPAEVVPADPAAAITEEPVPAVEAEAIADPAAIPAEEAAALSADGEGSDADATGADAVEPAPAEEIQVADEALETSIPDVPEDSWLYPFAASLQESDRLGELPTENFDISAPVTRAEFAALISQAEQVDGQATEAAGKFADVGENFWASSRIAGVLQTDFMQGYPAENGQPEVFRPGNQIPRYETLVAIATGLNLPLPEEAEIATILGQYDTTGMPDWAQPKVAAALKEGLVINPNDQSTLDPIRPTTRGEATAMIQQVLQREGKVSEVDSEVTVQPQ